MFVYQRVTLLSSTFHVCLRLVAFLLLVPLHILAETSLSCDKHSFVRHISIYLRCFFLVQHHSSVVKSGTVGPVTAAMALPSWSGHNAGPAMIWMKSSWNGGYPASLNVCWLKSLYPTKNMAHHGSCIFHYPPVNPITSH